MQDDARSIARRAKLLDIAVEIVLSADEDPSAWLHAVAVVSPLDVARAVGLSRTWMYQLWPTKQEFWQDLAIYECLRDDEAPLAKAGWRQVRETGSTPLEALRRAMNTLTADVRVAPGTVTFATVLGYSLPAEVAELKLLKQRRATAAIERLMVEWLIASGRHPVPGCSLGDLADMVKLLIDGGRMANVVAPWMLEPEWLLDDAQPWSILAYGARQLMARLTEPGIPITDHIVSPIAPQVEPANWTDRHRSALAAASVVFDQKLATPDNTLHAFGLLTVARLARRAGVSRQTVYNAFPSDDELRLALLRRLRSMHESANSSALRSWWRDATPSTDRALDFAEGCLMRFRGGRIPMLAFIPHVRDDVVAAELHGLSRRLVTDAAAAYDRYDAMTEHHVDAAHRADLALLTWLASRRRVQLYSTLNGPSSPETRRELALFAVVMNVFGVYGNDPTAPILLRELTPAARAAS